jgi:hypothetical protein
MVRFTLPSFAAAAALAFLVPGGAAQTPTPAGTSSPVLAPSTATPSAPTSSTPRRNRAVSGEVAAALAAASPKYSPPPPKPEPKHEEEQIDMRDVDKPKNGIVRLPKYIVQEAKPPVFRERDIYTQKGLTDIAVRRYISDADRALNRFTLPFIGITPEARALAMYAEDERLKNMSDLGEAAAAASKADPATGTYIRKEAQQTFMRTSDFGWNGGGPK